MVCDMSLCLIRGLLINSRNLCRQREVLLNFVFDWKIRVGLIVFHQLMIGIVVNFPDRIKLFVFQNLSAVHRKAGMH